MTTLDPGARLVLTHGFVASPRSTALRATSPAATITLGKPAGRHGPVRRLPMRETVYGDTWGESVVWAVDPPGTDVTTSRFGADNPTPAWPTA